MAWRMVALLVVLSAFALLAGCTSAGPRASSGTHAAAATRGRSATIPWQPLPARAGAIRLTSGDGAPLHCTPGALLITAPAAGGAGGTLYVPISVQNHGSIACMLRDGDLSFTWGPGTHAELRAGKTRTLLPGGSQRYLMGLTGSCVKIASPPVTHTPVSVALNGIPVTTHGEGVPDFASRCRDALVTPNEPVDAEDAGIGTYSSLRAAIQLPATITPGATLDYTLTLTNAGRDTFTFASCPTYTEIANVGGHVSTASYSLNCSGVSIAAGATATFAMQINLAAGTGMAKLGWLMDNGPSTVTAVSIP